ncbi:hypothetical protein [Dickeya chrysanthemi]|uniref:hypothetical protein n=1 Tax=Dickeya chrysanthemi TaxID=556 RepID=UPI0012DEBA2D|nr:hypothetical protein [Dickeya chrysanthemi]
MKRFLTAMVFSLRNEGGKRRDARCGSEGYGCLPVILHVAGVLAFLPGPSMGLALRAAVGSAQIGLCRFQTADKRINYRMKHLNGVKNCAEVSDIAA